MGISRKNANIWLVRRPPRKNKTEAVVVCRYARAGGNSLEMVAGCNMGEAMAALGRVRDMQVRYGTDNVITQLAKFRDLRSFVEYIELAEIAMRRDAMAEMVRAA